MTTDASSSQQGGQEWYEIASGTSDLEQGDILLNFPVLDLVPLESDTVTESSLVQSDLIILTNDCSLSTEFKTPTCHVILALAGDRYSYDGDYAEDDKGRSRIAQMEKGWKPDRHLLRRCDIAGFVSPERVVCFDQIYTVPYSYVRRLTLGSSRLRLRLPYRQHLAFAFGGYAMAPGLPVGALK